MQKVLQRTVFAERQAARRLAKRKEQNERIWRKSNRDQTRYSRKESTSLLKNARLARREDWELGPLKPRRDVGDSKDTYGTVSTQQLRGPVLEEEARKKAREAIGGRFMNIVKGDRVVLLSGKDKGKIGKINAVDTERCEFTVAGLNMVCSLPFPLSKPIVLSANPMLPDRCQCPQIHDWPRGSRPTSHPLHRETRSL
jgi:large subunit ribosomal protein L24